MRFSRMPRLFGCSDDTVRESYRFVVEEERDRMRVYDFIRAALRVKDDVEPRFDCLSSDINLGSHILQI
jgi:hypothetical protein